MAIITVERTAVDDGYFEMADAMYEAAAGQDGFLGMEWVYDSQRRVGITSSYWRDAESIRRWKLEAAHLVAQQLGKERWYEGYRVRVARLDAPGGRLSAHRFRLISGTRACCSSRFASVGLLLACVSPRWRPRRSVATSMPRPWGHSVRGQIGEITLNRR